MDRQHVLYNYHKLSKILDYQRPPVLNIKRVKINYLSNTVIGAGPSAMDYVDEAVAPGSVEIISFE